MSFKKTIIQQCNITLSQKLENIQLAMNIAQDSANAEEKSTAGDKHDTARAMSHLETEMNGKQLQEAQAQKAIFGAIDFEVAHNKAQIGSLIQSKEKFFFIAVGLGIIEIDSKKIAVCSPSAPVAQAILGKKVGDLVQFGTLSFEIDSIC